MDEDIVEGGGRRVGTPLKLEEHRHRNAPVDLQRVTPTQLTEGHVELLPALALGCAAQAPLEELALGAVHHRSVPRSSRRRAMMLRWISALPP